MDFAAEHSVLISAANKAFGEDKWCHTIVSQNLGIYTDTYLDIYISIYLGVYIYFYLFIYH